MSNFTVSEWPHEFTIPVLKQAAEKINVSKLSGIPYGQYYPFKRAIKSITGVDNYYCWGPGASRRAKS